MTELFLFGRILFGGFFIYNGIHHFMDVSTMASYAAGKGVPMAEAAILGTGVMLIVGGGSVLLGLWPRFGILCTALFLLGVTPVMHNFWHIPDPGQRMIEMTSFLKNLALLGGTLMLVAVPRPWAHSVEARRRIVA